MLVSDGMRNICISHKYAIGLVGIIYVVVIL